MTKNYDIKKALREYANTVGIKYTTALRNLDLRKRLLAPVPFADEALPGWARWPLGWSPAQSTVLYPEDEAPIAQACREFLNGRSILTRFKLSVPHKYEGTLFVDLELTDGALFRGFACDTESFLPGIAIAFGIGSWWSQPSRNSFSCDLEPLEESEVLSLLINMLGADLWRFAVDMDEAMGGSYPHQFFIPIDEEGFAIEASPPLKDVVGPQGSSPLWPVRRTACLGSTALDFVNTMLDERIARQLGTIGVPRIRLRQPANLTDAN